MKLLPLLKLSSATLSLSPGLKPVHQPLSMLLPRHRLTSRSLMVMAIPRTQVRVHKLRAQVTRGQAVLNLRSKFRSNNIQCLGTLSNPKTWCRLAQEYLPIRSCIQPRISLAYLKLLISPLTTIKAQVLKARCNLTRRHQLLKVPAEVVKRRLLLHRYSTQRLDYFSTWEEETRKRSLTEEAPLIFISLRIHLT